MGLWEPIRSLRCGGTWPYQLYCHREQAALRHTGRESAPVTRLLMITHPPAVLPSACFRTRPRQELRSPSAARAQRSPSP